VAFLHISLFSKSKTEKHELIFKQIIWINHRIQYAKGIIQMVDSDGLETQCVVYERNGD